MSRPLRSIVVCLIAFFGLSADCTRTEASSEYDLVEAFSLAEGGAETSLIEIGSAAARPHLVDGWRNDEHAGNMTFVWAIGSESSIRWLLTERRDVRMTFRCWPFPSSRTQTIDVLVNGNEIQRIELGPTVRNYTVTIPADRLVRGWNQTTFRYGFHRQKSSPIAVAWDWLRIEPLHDGDAPQKGSDPDVPSLVLPARAQLDYYLTIGEGTRLVADGIVANGDTNEAALPKIELQIAGSHDPTTYVLEGKGPYSFDLPVSSSTLARLSLYVPRNDGIATKSSWTLQRPRLVSESYVGLEETAQIAHGNGDSAPRPNVIMYLIDTLRADHLGCYGYPKPTSPNIDAFAKEATLFVHPVAQSSWTRASIASIFTGLRPLEHGTIGRDDSLSPEAVTLAELLRDAGYDTLGLTTNGNVAPSVGFDQGFRTYELIGPAAGDVPAASIDMNQQAFAWLAQLRSDRPLFLFLHTVAPHGPYTPPQPFRDQFAANVTDPNMGSGKMLRDLHAFRIPNPISLRDDLIALYDAEIASDDARFGTIVAELKRLNLYDSAMIIVISDHGEEFADHGWWEHGRSLYEEQLRVPLIVKFPNGRGAGRRITTTAQHIDVLPTILEYAGVALPASLPGRSLAGTLNGSSGNPVAAVSYLNLDGFEADSTTRDRWKLIREHKQAYGPHRPKTELFDLERDPGEQQNLVDDDPVRAGYLRTLLRAATNEENHRLRPKRAVLSESVKEHLRALGYLN